MKTDEALEMKHNSLDLVPGLYIMQGYNDGVKAHFLWIWGYVWSQQALWTLPSRNGNLSRLRVINYDSGNRRSLACGVVEAASPSLTTHLSITRRNFFSPLIDSPRLLRQEKALISLLGSNKKEFDEI